MQAISFLHSKRKEIETIESAIVTDALNLIDETLFLPIKKVLAKKPNFPKIKAFPNLITALKKGDVLYLMSRQAFFVKNGKEGIYTELNEVAIFNSTERAYKVNYQSLPVELQSIIAVAVNQAEEMAKEIQDILLLGGSFLLAKEMKKTFAPKLEKIAEIGTKTIDKNIAKEIPQMPETPNIAKEIPQMPETPNKVETIFKNHYEGYADSTEKYIIGFLQEERVELRKKVANLRLQGGDVNSLRDVIEKGRNLTESRVKLIVRQETALANSAYEKKRYAELGMQFFKWVHPNPTKETARPHHVDWARQSKEDKVLFDAENPPKNPQTGEEEMPSEPFNCTCYAVYVKKIENLK